MHIPEISIGSASASDAALLAEIHQQSFVKYWNVKDFTGMLAVAGTRALLAGSEGMILTRTLEGQSEILTTAVKPASRRRGIGRALLAAAKKEALAAEARTMFLEVDAANEAAKNLYESEGFAVISRRKGYYRHQDGTFTDALVMRTELA